MLFKEFHLANLDVLTMNAWKEIGMKEKQTINIKTSMSVCVLVHQQFAVFDLENRKQKALEDNSCLRATNQNSVLTEIYMLLKNC